jgi:DNA-binding GntR family transcriptional regulator
MTRKMIDNNALSNLIKQSIIEDIIVGRVQPGEKLVEAKYAEEFGTSRAPIREAFYLLTLEGYVQKIPRKGTVVKGFTIEEIRDVLEIRSFLEELALDRISRENMDACLANMTEIVRQMEQNRAEQKEYARLNYQFHYQMIAASGSDVLKNSYIRLGTPLLSLQTMSFMAEEHINKSLSEHKQIIQYLREGELEAAKKLLVAHNKAVFPRIEKHFVTLSTVDCRERREKR